MAYNYNRQARSSIVPDKVKKDIKQAHAQLAELVKTYERLFKGATDTVADLGRKAVAAQVAQEMGRKYDGPSIDELDGAITLLNDVLRLGQYNSSLNEMDLRSLAAHVKGLRRF